MYWSEMISVLGGKDNENQGILSPYPIIIWKKPIVLGLKDIDK